LSRLQKFVFYLKPGDRLEFAATDETYTFIGENTKENIAMKAWFDYILPLERMAVYPPFRETFAVFFPLLVEKTEGLPLLALPATGNKKFDEAFAIYRKFDVISLATAFLKMPRGNFGNDDFPDFYRRLNLEELTKTADVLRFPFDVLSSIAHVESRLHGTDRSNLIDNVRNDTIKGELFLSNLARARDLTVMEQLIKMYEKYAVTKDQNQRLQQTMERIKIAQADSDVGKPGHNFTYVDVHGNNVSFSDFRGKIVYMDIWATWCTPCRAEIPHLKRLKEHFKGNEDIVIVGISSDRPRDFERWKEFVVTHELGDIQLWGGIEGEQNIMRLYEIGSIPRFLLFDREGKIISTNAPRASSAEILPLLERLLQER